MLLKKLNKLWVRYGWGFLLFKKQKVGRAGVLIYLKCWNKVTLESYIVENAKIKNG